MYLAIGNSVQVLVAETSPGTAILSSIMRNVKEKLVKNLVILLNDCNKRKEERNILLLLCFR